MRNISDETCSGNPNTFYGQCIVSRKPCVYEIMCKNMVACQVTDENIMRRMRFACWITKATNTHSEYVTPVAFPRQQWFHKRASMLRYMYTACLVTTEVLIEESKGQLQRPQHNDINQIQYIV